MAFYKSKYTGTEIDQRLAQATYDDAVLAGFEGSKEEFDAILGKLKEIADKAENSIQTESENLDTFNKNVVDAINELHRELQAKPDEQDVIDQGELEVFKDEIAAKYATREELEGDIQDANSKISTLNNNLVESVNTINKNVNDSLIIVNQAIQQNSETLVAEIDQRKEADKEIKSELNTKVDWVDYNNTKNIVLPSNGQIFGDFGGEESNSSLLGARIYNAGLENEEKQVEVGTSKVHLNLNSLDKPTIETPDGKENLVVESDIESWAKSQDPTLIPSIKLDDHVVKYSDFSYIPSGESDPVERKTIQLNNYDSISGMNTEGSDAANLIMMSKWNKVDIGSSRYPVNFNGSEFTLNDNRNIAKVYETKALTDLAEGAADSAIRSALGLDFEDLIEIITDENVIIVDRTSIGDYKTCIHATGNISSDNGAANLMFFIGTTPTIYQIQYVNGTYALAVDEYKFATKSDISNLATKDELPSLDGYATTTELETKVDKVEGKQLSTEDYTTEEKEKLSKVNPDLISVAVNFPIRTSGGSDGPEKRVYTQEEILDWFGVKDVASLKNQIAKGGIQYIKYGISLSGNPYYYKMPVEYCAFESANQIKLVFTGLNTRDDTVSKYEILVNLDGTLITENSNVKMTITSVEPEDINLSEYATKKELNDYALKSEIPTQYIVEEGAALQAGDEQHEFNIKSGGRVTVNSANEVVTYTPYPGEEGRKMLVLANNDSLTGTKTDGTGAPLAFMSKWDKIEIGNSTTPLNLNSLNGEITINDDKVVATTDQIQAPYEINLTNLLSAEDSESISTAIGGIDNLNATVQDNRIIVGTISNGSVSVSIRILGNVTTLYYLLDSVVGLTLNEVSITNTSGTLSKNVTTHSVLTENMVINSLDLDETTLPLSAAQGKVLNSDKQNKTDETLQTTDKTIVGAINELLAKVQELETKNTELESRLAALEETN